MPKNTSQRIIDSRATRSGAVFTGGTGGGGGGVTDHGALTGLADDDHGQYHNDARGDARYVPLSRTITSGNGLTGGGALSGNLTLAIGAGAGLTVNADDVALTTPGTLTVSSSNSASGNHTHAITSSSAPGAAATILASSSAGDLTLQRYNADVYFRAVGLPADPNASDAAYFWNQSGVGATVSGLNVDFRTGATGSQASRFRVLQDGTLVSKGYPIAADNYASQVTGWRVTYDGQADFRYLYVDEMHAKSFIADLEQALAGGQIISKSVAMLGATFTAPAASGTATLTVRDLPSAANMAVFQSGDIVRLRTFTRSGGSLTIADCWGVVTSYADQADGLQTWTFTRSSGGNAGTMTAGTTVAADSIVLDYGTTGNGYYEINAIDGAYGANSPYAQVVTWATHPATGQTVRTRMGNLYGVTSQSGEYGLWAGAGTSNDSSYLRVSSYAVRLNNVPITLYNSGTQTVNISSTGTDIWVGPSSSDKRLTWDGTTLSIKGQASIRGGSAVDTSAGAGLYLGSDKMGYYNGTNWLAHIDTTLGLTLPISTTSSVDSGSIRFRSGSTDKAWIKAYTDPSTSFDLLYYYTLGVHVMQGTVWVGLGESASRFMVFGNSSTEPTLVANTINKRVGINKLSPIVTLDVVGDVNFSTSRGVSYFADSGTDANAYEMGLLGAAGKNAWWRFAENGVANRWIMGIRGGDANLYFETGYPGSSTERLRLDGSGNVYTPDADVSGIWGRAQVGSAGFTDVAGFAHRDRANTTDYSIAHNSSGKTVINSASGQSIDFRIGGATNYAYLNTTMFEVIGAIATQKYIEFNTAYSGTDGPGGEFGKIRLFLRNAGTGKYEIRWVSRNISNTATRGGVIFDTTEGADIP